MSLIRVVIAAEVLIVAGLLAITSVAIFVILDIDTISPIVGALLPESLPDVVQRQLLGEISDDGGREEGGGEDDAGGVAQLGPVQRDEVVGVVGREVKEARGESVLARLEEELVRRRRRHQSEEDRRKRCRHLKEMPIRKEEKKHFHSCPKRRNSDYDVIISADWRQTW